MGKVTALILGLAGLSLMAVGIVIVIGALARFAKRLWNR